MNERILPHIQQLKHYRDDFKDEIPDEIVSGKVEYKVQTNWLSFVSTELQLMKNRSVIDNPKLLRSAQRFIEMTHSRKEINRPRAILYANLLITHFLNSYPLPEESSDR